MIMDLFIHFPALHWSLWLYHDNYQYNYVPETACRANNWYTTYMAYNRKILLHKYTVCTQTSFYKSECEK